VSTLDAQTQRLLAAQKAKGKRPWFYQNAEAERVLNVVLALTQELAVTRERLDTLEQLLERKGLMARAEFDAFVPSAELAAERSRLQQDYLARVFRVMTQSAESEADVASDAASIEELASS
jgi:hypothetical protein